MPSFKSEMLCQGSWCSNGQRFATAAEAEAAGRWTVPTDYRAATSADVVNCRFDDAANRVVWLP